MRFVRLLLFFTLVVFVAESTWGISTQADEAKLPPGKVRYVVLVSVDGLSAR